MGKSRFRAGLVKAWGWLKSDFRWVFSAQRVWSWRRVRYRWREWRVRRLARKSTREEYPGKPSAHAVHGRQCWSLNYEVAFCQGWMSAYACWVRYGAVSMLPDEHLTHAKVQEAVFDKEALKLIVPRGWDLPGNLSRK